MCFVFLSVYACRLRMCLIKVEGGGAQTHQGSTRDILTGQRNKPFSIVNLHIAERALSNTACNTLNQTLAYLKGKTPQNKQLNTVEKQKQPLHKRMTRLLRRRLGSQSAHSGQRLPVV